MSPASLHWISASDPPQAFPPVEHAQREPDGLLAAGGDLSQSRLLYAYRHGIFPWYNEGEPILWWSPDPRCVIRPERLHVSRRLRQSLRRGHDQITFNRAFDQVIAACAAPRRDHGGTWITNDMNNAFRALHRSGWAHSVEVWRDGALVGGLYGLAMHGVFFGESMFSRETNGSKVALIALCSVVKAKQFELLDCQVASPHLLTMGAELLARERFVDLLNRRCRQEPVSPWPEQPLEAAALTP